MSVGETGLVYTAHFIIIIVKNFSQATYTIETELQLIIITTFQDDIFKLLAFLFQPTVQSQIVYHHRKQKNNYISLCFTG